MITYPEDDKKDKIHVSCQPFFHHFRLLSAVGFICVIFFLFISSLEVGSLHLAHVSSQILPSSPLHSYYLSSVDKNLFFSVDSWKKSWSSGNWSFLATRILNSSDLCCTSPHRAEFSFATPAQKIRRTQPIQIETNKDEMSKRELDIVENFSRARVKSLESFWHATAAIAIFRLLSVAFSIPSAQHKRNIFFASSSIIGM